MKKKAWLRSKSIRQAQVFISIFSFDRFLYDESIDHENMKIDFEDEY